MWAETSPPPGVSLHKKSFKNSKLGFLFPPWSCYLFHVWITSAGCCSCQHRHVLTSDQSWTLQVSRYLLGLFWRRRKQGSGLGCSHPCSAHLFSVQSILWAHWWIHTFQQQTQAHRSTYVLHTNIFSNEYRKTHMASFPRCSRFNKKCSFPLVNSLIIHPSWYLQYCRTEREMTQAGSASHRFSGLC